MSAGGAHLPGRARPRPPTPTANDFENVADTARTLNPFEQHWNKIAEPFDWRFTRDDLAALIDRLATHEPSFSWPRDGERTYGREQ